MSRPRTRQELYDRIRESSKDEVILEEMIQLGFWPRAQGSPHNPADEIRRRGELHRRLRELRQRSSQLHNLAALEREARKRRLAESRRRRAENKERRLRERAERAEAWKVEKTRDIKYLGAGVSAGLGPSKSDGESDGESNGERLRASDLPELQTAADIANAMGISVGALRFLAFARTTSRTSHYRRFKLKKRTGGERLISAPMPRLRTAQRWILDHVLERVAPHPAAHGFRKGRSIVSNASAHLGADVVVNLDLQDFFPTVSYRRVKGLFRHLGYSEATAVIFALICTEPDVAETELDGTTYYVALGERHLPQGAPTSPAVTNLLCRRLDRRLAGASHKIGFTYTRYADDLSFSGSGQARHNVGRLLRQVGWIVAREGFVVHPDKTRVFHRSRRQEVTGLVVNERPNVARATRKRFRATLFQIEKDGPEGKNWNGNPDVISAIVGFANYLAMVDGASENTRELVRRARALGERYRPQPPTTPPSSPASPPADESAQAASSEPVPTSETSKKDPPKPKKKKKWWKIF